LLLLFLLLFLLHFVCVDPAPLQFIVHLLEIIGPRASVVTPWVDHVTVNALLSALEMENDVMVIHVVFFNQNLHEIYCIGLSSFKLQHVVNVNQFSEPDGGPCCRRRVCQ
jgi:hypothetical protein